MRRKAFTLPELLVAAGLSVLTLSILVLILIPISRTSARTVRQLELSHLSQLTSRRLLQDLQTAPMANLSWPEPAQFRIRPLERLSASGKPVAGDYQVAYSSQNDSLVRWEIPSDPSLPAGRSRVLVRGCLSRFELRKISGRTLELQFVLSAESARIEFQEVVFLRNE